MKTIIFRDFIFTARHHMAEKSGAAGFPHWHTYTVRLWFEAVHDQDDLVNYLAVELKAFPGANLNAMALPGTSDEALAELFLERFKGKQCVRVRVTNDGHRGAEVSI